MQKTKIIYLKIIIMNYYIVLNAKGVEVETVTGLKAAVKSAKAIKGSYKKAETIAKSTKKQAEKVATKKPAAKKPAAKKVTEKQADTPKVEKSTLSKKQALALENLKKSGFAIGDKVSHRFGEGIITKVHLCVGCKFDIYVSVKFENKTSGVQTHTLTKIEK